MSGLRSVDMALMSGLRSVDRWFGSRSKNNGTYVHLGDLLDIIERYKKGVSDNPELKERNPEYARGAGITLDLLARGITESISRSTYI